MPAAVTTMPSSRETAESGDIYFGRNGRKQQESLLGQALQLPSLGIPNDDDDNEYDNNSDHEFYENLTPTFSTRKRSEGNRTPVCSNNYPRRGNNRNSFSSTASTPRGGGAAGAMSNSSSADPLSMSTTSFHSEDVPPIVPQSVDTVPTSNATIHHQLLQKKMAGNGNKLQGILNPSPQNKLRMSVSPPSDLRLLGAGNSNSAKGAPSGGGKRSVFGNRVQQRYPAYGRQMPTPPPPADPAPFYNIIDTGEQITFQQAEQQPPEWETLSPTPRQINTTKHVASAKEQATGLLPMVVTASTASSSSSGGPADAVAEKPTQLPPPDGPSILSPVPMQPISFSDLVSPLKSPSLVTPTVSYQQSSSGNMGSFTSPTTPSRRRKTSKSSLKGQESLPIHETVHAQSLLLGLCFMAIWSPNNIMAPNLTQIATFYNMNETERDLYLGSFLALATGVLSFPLSAAIGILSDLYSRKRLFVGTAIGGALASVATGCSPTYRWLLLARFFSGGFMSASVSVSFSLLGDLFATEERNAASSGLTAMMGMGIILGQVFAGVVGSTKGWQHPFWVSGGITAVLGVCVALLVQEPIRGGKEKVLQDMLKQGKKYDRKLTWDGFWSAMRNNRSNGILMTQGFFSSLPWGIIFVFLNDYLSQERGFSVPDATFIVLVFGVGCAAGGIIGGYIGARIQKFERSFLPLFMAATTILAALPFVGLLNGHTKNAHGYLAVGYSFMGGCLASMPSVNVRPCLINVNPPETRGASLTAANLIINVARGVGPSCITLLGSTFDLSRQYSFNVTIIAFWAISALQLCMLAKTLPSDQDTMEEELARYAAAALARVSSPNREKCHDTPVVEFELHPEQFDSCMSLDDVSLVSIEDRMSTFEGTAAREAISFFQKGVKELNFPSGSFCHVPHHGKFILEADSSEDEEYDEEEERQRDAMNILNLRDEGDDTMSPIDLIKRRDLWRQQQQRMYGTLAADDGENVEVVLHDEENASSANEKTRLID